MKLVITTVGTSFFTNDINHDVRDTFVEYQKRYESIDGNDGDTYEKLIFKSSNEYNERKKDIDKIKKVLIKNWFSGVVRDTKNDWIIEDGTFNTHASAEIKSILKIREKFENKSLEVHLIATDTVLSRLAAELIVMWFEKYNDPNISVQFDHDKDVCKGFQIKDGEEFERNGIPNLMDMCDRIVSGNYSNTIINITGGYKAVLPYMTIYAQVNNIPLYYIFEDTDNLIHIPQAPFDINWGVFEKYSFVFRELEASVEESWESYKRRNNLQDDFNSCVYEIKNNDDFLIGLNAIGNIFWKRYQNFFLVHIPRGSKYFGENISKKHQLEKVFRELYKKLIYLDEPFEKLKDKILKHAKIYDTYVYKHTFPQIRIQYSYKDNQLIMYNYYFIDSNDKDTNYSKYMRDEFEKLQKSSLTSVTFLKGD